MPTLTINGKSVTVPPGTPVIRAAAELGINIPHFCYHPALSAPANCRMCLVEIERARKLEPACYAKCNEGMVVHTENEKVHTARRAVLEFILINHPVDCPICDQAGECKLQDYYMAYDARPSRLRTHKVAKSKVYPIGPHVVYDGERCILCTRCVRFCDEITGTSELTVVDRGDASEIRTFPGIELDNPYAMNVTDICPVGALTTRDFRFKCRVWLLSSTDSICVGCAKGCNVHLEHFQGEVQRYRPRFNPEVNEYWMCDAGRLSYKALHHQRISQPVLNGDSSLSWPRFARALAELLAPHKGSKSAFVTSAQSTCEGLYAGQAFASNVLETENVFWIGEPDGDQDELLVRSDKNPNRAGVHAVFGDALMAKDANALLTALEAGEIRMLYVAGGSLPYAGDDLRRFIDACRALELLVVQSPTHNALTEIAHATLPSCTHAEQEGTFINEDGIVQAVYQAFKPANLALPDWEIFVRIARAANVSLGFDDTQDIQERLFEVNSEA